MYTDYTLHCSTRRKTNDDPGLRTCRRRDPRADLAGAASELAACCPGKRIRPACGQHVGIEPRRTLHPEKRTHMGTLAPRGILRNDVFKLSSCRNRDVSTSGALVPDFNSVPPRFIWCSVRYTVYGVMDLYDRTSLPSAALGNDIRLGWVLKSWSRTQIDSGRGRLAVVVKVPTSHSVVNERAPVLPLPRRVCAPESPTAVQLSASTKPYRASPVWHGAITSSKFPKWPDFAATSGKIVAIRSHAPTHRRQCQTTIIWCFRPHNCRLEAIASSLRQHLSKALSRAPYSVPYPAVCTADDTDFQPPSSTPHRASPGDSPPLSKRDRSWSGLLALHWLA